MKRLTDSQIDDIIKRYQAGEQSKDIAAFYGIYDSSVARILRNNGIERTRIKRLPQEQLDKAVKMYVEDKMSSELIAKQFDVDSGVIVRAIKKSGAKIRPSTENKRQYKIDDTFFEKVDNEAKAYFLGLLYADGGLSSKQGSTTLSLQIEDRDILEKLSMIIYGFVNIHDRYHKDVDRTYSDITIYSQKLHGDLIKLGCTPKKSFTIKFPTFDIVPEALVHHFIRGFMDGDGCICITNENRPRVDFTSALPFLEGLVAYLNPRLGLNITRFGERHPDRETNTRNIQIQGFRDTRLLLDFLYDGATLFLNRKKVKYDELLLQQQRKQSRKVAKSTDVSLYGTTYVPEYNGQQLTQQYLETLSPEDKQPIVDFLVGFYRSNGFPYTKLSNDLLLKEFTALKQCDVFKIAKDDILSITNQTGTQVFKHFAPQFFETTSGINRRSSVLQAFNDDSLLRKVVENRVNGNFNMTGNMLKQGFAVSNVAVKASIFNCVLARYIYTQYTKEGSAIYDYSMGFGQRLLAALSLPHRVEFIGVDPFDRMVQSNQAIFDFYNANVPMLNKTVDLRCMGSEDFCDSKYEGKIDLAFSSPPYYNLEVYSDDDDQAYATSYVDFLQRYWKKTVANIDKMLAKDGKFVLNITAGLVDGFDVGTDMTNVVREAGFEVEREYKIQLSRNLEFGGQKESHKTEPIYVFRRKQAY